MRGTTGSVSAAQSVGDQCLPVQLYSLLLFLHYATAAEGVVALALALNLALALVLANAPCFFPMSFLPRIFDNIDRDRGRRGGFAALPGIGSKDVDEPD